MAPTVEELPHSGSLTLVMLKAFRAGVKEKEMSLVAPMSRMVLPDTAWRGPPLSKKGTVAPPAVGERLGDTVGEGVAPPAASERVGDTVGERLRVGERLGEGVVVGSATFPTT